MLHEFASQLILNVTLEQTAVAVGVEPENKLPYNEYYEYFGPDYTLHIEPKKTVNKNSARYLEALK